MDYSNKLAPKNITAVDVFLEGRKTRKYVGRLTHANKKYCFEYDKTYLYNINSIPVGPELPLTQKTYCATKLFESFHDRIPSKQNPAYKDYCKQTSIEASETNKIILLSTIGRRGPSSFIYEPVYKEILSADRVKAFRKRLNFSIREFATIFHLSTTTLQKIEKNKSVSKETLRRIELYYIFPELAIFEILRNGGCLTDNKKTKTLKMLYAIKKY